MYNEIAYLTQKVKTNSVTEYGDPVYRYDKKEVFVQVLSVTRSEFYAAQTAGIDPKIVFEIADYYDYDGQEFVEYEEVIYKVIRTYRKDISMQIICSHVDGA